MSKVKKMCTMPGCNRPMAYKISQLCDCCYAFNRRWDGRSSIEIIKRAQTLERWTKRMETIIPKKVSRIGKKRKVV